jgi:hypothetical protein
VLNVKKLTIKHFLTTFILALSFAAAPVAAGPSEDAAAAISRGDYTTALRLWRALATLGDVKAQMWLGQIYEDGLSDKIPQDYAEAVKWYRLAANQDDPDCQFFLAEMYFMGQGLIAGPYSSIHVVRFGGGKGGPRALLIVSLGPVRSTKLGKQLICQPPAICVRATLR